MTSPVTSPAFSIDKKNLKHIGKVFLWTVGATAVTAVITVLNSMQIPVEYAVLLPVVNTVLVAIQQFMSAQTRDSE